MEVTTNDDYFPIQCVYCAVRCKSLNTTKVNLTFKRWHHNSTLGKQYVGRST